VTSGKQWTTTVLGQHNSSEVIEVHLFLAMWEYRAIAMRFEVVQLGAAA